MVRPKNRHVARPDTIRRFIPRDGDLRTKEGKLARRRRSSLTVTADQARQALSFLVQEGKVAAGEVRKALSRRERLIREIRERLEKLGVDGLELTTRLAKGATRKIRAARKSLRRPRQAPQPVRKRAKPRISAATRKIYQAQGRYMAALRPLSKEARTEIKAVREKSGINAATAAAKRMVR
jgi:hypothetical protein